MSPRALVLLVLWLPGCRPASSPADEAGGAAGVFAVGTTPRLQVGVSDGDPLLAFDMVQGARRLPDGGLVVADGGIRQVRWFAADGTPVRGVGRRGEGPGEYQGPLSLVGWPGDTVAVLDFGNNRLTLLDGAGAVVRTLIRDPAADDGLPWRPWLERRTVVFNAAGPGRMQCVRAALHAMPAPDPEGGIRFLTVDDEGRLWLREGADSAGHWSVWRQDGTLLGEVQLPGSFHLLHATAGEVVGRVEADDLTERVVALPIPDRRDAGGCLPADSLPAPTEVDRGLMVHTRNLFVVQEAMYADGNSYSRVPDPTLISVPEQVSFWMLEATPVGWMGGVIDRVSGQACVTAVGRTSVTGWPDGAIVCGG